MVKTYVFILLRLTKKTERAVRVVERLLKNPRRPLGGCSDLMS
jgi:hypothetical protein